MPYVGERNQNCSYGAAGLSPANLGLRRRQARSLLPDGVVEVAVAHVTQSSRITDLEGLIDQMVQPGRCDREAGALAEFRSSMVGGPNVLMMDGCHVQVRNGSNCVRDLLL